MKRIVPILAVVVLAAVTVAAAQVGPGRHAMGPGPMMGGQGPRMGGPGGPGGVPFGQYLYPPELVLRNQIKIGAILQNGPGRPLCRGSRFVM